jgi:hypothetical protein
MAMVRPDERMSPAVNDVSDGFTWAALLAGIIGMLLGARRRRRTGGQPAGGRHGHLAALLFGLVVLLNTVPRLAGAPSGVTLALSLIALVPLIGFITVSAHLARAGQQ